MLIDNLDGNGQKLHIWRNGRTGYAKINLFERNATKIDGIFGQT